MKIFYAFESHISTRRRLCKNAMRRDPCAKRRDPSVVRRFIARCGVTRP
jgi:hypothetical protein